MLIRLGLIPAVYIREPGWLMLSMLACGVLSVAAVSGRLVRFDPLALELGVWCAWTLCALATALVLPGASVLFLPVALIATATRALLVRSRGAVVWTQAAAVLALAAVWFPAWALAPDTFGISALIVFAAPAAWISSLLLPGLAALGARRRGLLVLTTSGVAVFALGGHVLARKFDDDSPQRVNVIAYTDASAQRSLAIIDASWSGANADAPAAMVAALTRLAKQAPRYAPAFAWRSTSLLFAPLSELAPPTAAMDVSAASAGAGATTLRLQLAPSVRRLLCGRSSQHPSPRYASEHAAGLRSRARVALARAIGPGHCTHRPLTQP